jgi:peptidoglycan/LPS O-acetylase OafA/YrhL
MARSQANIAILDPLRGMAALSVTLYHFSGGFLPETATLATLARHGHAGVEAFFVISGFIITLSMHHRGYVVRDAAQFMLRRLKRLEPPYLASLALCVGLLYASSITPGYKGEGFDFGWSRIAAHIGYANAVLGMGWINPVYWTLAIEFQFYLFMSIYLGALLHKNPSIRITAIAVIQVMAYLFGGSEALIPHWLPIFTIGIIACQGRCIQQTRPELLGLLIITGASLLLNNSAHEIVAGLLTGVAIAYFGKRDAPLIVSPLAKLGVISYSLYLLHVPVGSRVLHLIDRFDISPPVRYLGLLLALIVSIVAASLFWLWIEKPSQKWSRGRT